MDVEKGNAPSRDGELSKAPVKELSWDAITVDVKHRSTGQPVQLLSNVNGHLMAGEMLALMGPSGSGKTTLLNILARRGAATTGKVYVDGTDLKLNDFREISAFVEQEDALIGSMTVRETVAFAAKLSLTGSKADRKHKVDALLASFGLVEQADTIVGTPIQKGISGGQKRRTSVAAQLVTDPHILFLDEPTSGLDSVASYEVISYIKRIAKARQILVVASIHQPSTTTFELFDKLLLLSEGKVAYNGRTDGVQSHFAFAGYPLPQYMNPAEHIIDLVNTDFSGDREQARRELDKVVEAWNRSEPAAALSQAVQVSMSNPNFVNEASKARHPSVFSVTLSLIQRNFLKSYRDVIAYGIRIAMYMGLAIMMGTVWLRLSTEQANIQNFINAIFFGGAFMSFMAVAYIPAFVEDLHTFRRERLNGLYGPLPFMIANFVTGLPYLFLISVLFSVVAYWLGNFRNSGTAFMRWVLYLFLDLVAAESLVVLVSCVIPIFVVALALTAFANGLWMCVNGFLVSMPTLNVFWKYVFHYIDYQAYVFQGMMVNEFDGRTYQCAENQGGEGFYCMYPPTSPGSGEIDGVEVLKAYGYATGRFGKWVGILCGIIVVYRLFGLIALYLRRH